MYCDQNKRMLPDMLWFVPRLSQWFCSLQTRKAFIACLIPAKQKLRFAVSTLEGHWLPKGPFNFYGMTGRGGGADGIWGVCQKMAFEVGRGLPIKNSKKKGDQAKF